MIMSDLRLKSSQSCSFINIWADFICRCGQTVHSYSMPVVYLYSTRYSPASVSFCDSDCTVLQCLSTIAVENNKILQEMSFSTFLFVLLLEHLALLWIFHFPDDSSLTDETRENIYFIFTFFWKMFIFLQVKMTDGDMDLFKMLYFQTAMHPCQDDSLFMAELPLFCLSACSFWHLACTTQ